MSSIDAAHPGFLWHSPSQSRPPRHDARLMVEASPLAPEVDPRAQRSSVWQLAKMRGEVNELMSLSVLSIDCESVGSEKRRREEETESEMEEVARCGGWEESDVGGDLQTYE